MPAGALQGTHALHVVVWETGSSTGLMIQPDADLSVPPTPRWPTPSSFDTASCNGLLHVRQLDAQHLVSDEASSPMVDVTEATPQQRVASWGHQPALTRQQQNPLSILCLEKPTVHGRLRILLLRNRVLNTCT